MKTKQKHLLACTGFTKKQRAVEMIAIVENVIEANFLVFLRTESGRKSLGCIMEVLSTVLVFGV